MESAYELLGIGRNATRSELDAAFAARKAEYDPARIGDLPPEFVELAAERRAALEAAYRALRPAVAAPLQLSPAAERRRDRETLAALLVLVTLALAVLLLRDVAVPQRTVSVVGAEAAALASEGAPDFTLESLDGNPVRLSDLKGQVVLINFWATWCPPCVREMPRLVRVSEAYRDQGLVVLGINTTYQDDRAKVAQFARDQRISYPVLLDVTGEVGQLYPARLLPTTYLIDRDGRIVHTKVGEVDEATLTEQIRALLAAKPGAS